MKRGQSTVFAVAIVIVAMVAAMVGWCLNIYHLATMSFDPVTPTLVLRCVGVVVAPIGAVMGWIA